MITPSPEWEHQDNPITLSSQDEQEAPCIPNPAYRFGTQLGRIGRSGAIIGKLKKTYTEKLTLSSSKVRNRGNYAQQQALLAWGNDKTNTTKHARCYLRSTTGSPKALIPPICKRRRRCSTNCVIEPLAQVCNPCVTPFSLRLHSRDMVLRTKKRKPQWKPSKRDPWLEKTDGCG